MSYLDFNLCDFLELPKRDIEAFKKFFKSSRIEAFPFLDNKNLEAFKLIDECDRDKVFEYLDYKDIEAFKLLSENKRGKLFYLLDHKSLDAYRLLDSYWRTEASCSIEDTYIDLETFKSLSSDDQLFYSNSKLLIENLDYFKAIKGNWKCSLFQYLKNKSFEIYKNYLDSSQKASAFQYLEKKILKLSN